MFVVEKGIPKLPKESKNKWPFKMMEVGDSFLIPAEDVKKNVQIRSNATTSARYQGMKASCQIQPDGSVRVWRIA